MAVADIVRRMNVAVKIRGFHHSGWPSCWYIVVPAVEQWPEKMNSN